MGKIQKTISAIIAKQLAVRRNDPADGAIPTPARLLGSFLASATVAIVLDAIWSYLAVSGLASISTRNNSVTGMACWAMRPRIRQIG
jgi:hypothetical protein